MAKTPVTKSIADTYKVLDEIEHIRKRTGMYAGSTSLDTKEEFVFNEETLKMEKRSISYIPAFIKIFSEILDNSIDESKRAPETLNSIRVDIDRTTGTITIADNGRGIPVQIHPDTGKYVPETIFSNLRAGSNFNDDEDQSLIGTNGVGSTITNVLSSEFNIETADGKNQFKQQFTNGMRTRSEPKIKASTHNGTKITFTPDYKFFKLDGLDDGHFSKIHKKLIDAAGCNTGVKFYLNGKRIEIRNFGDYVKLYAEETVYDENKDWKVGLIHSDGFEQVSFVNSVDTYQGGTHVDYIANQILTKLREYIEKKYKLKIKPNDIKNHLMLIISCNINRPKFSSQTKENMISNFSDYKTSFDIPDKFIRQIIASPIIQSVLDWAMAKEDAMKRAELRKMNKDIDKGNPKDIEKLQDATDRKDRRLAKLFLAEGDSASQAIPRNAETIKTTGIFPLRGKPLNVSGIDTLKLVANAEFKNIMTIMGLQLGVKLEEVKDGKWYEIVLNGKKQIVNEFDSVLIDGKWTSVYYLI